MYSIPILDAVRSRVPPVDLELPPEQQAAAFFRQADQLALALAPNWHPVEMALARGQDLLAAFDELLVLLQHVCSRCERDPLLWPASLRGERAAELLGAHFAAVTRRLATVDEGSEQEWRALAQTHASVYARLTALYERLRLRQAAVGGICRRRAISRRR